MFEKNRNRGKPFPYKVHGIHYLHTGNTCYSPCREKDGIHCTGDKFDYIVAWQVPKKTRQSSTTNNLYV